MNVCFHVEGKPVSLNNAYFNRQHGRTMTAEARLWKELVAWQARLAYKGLPTKDRVGVSIYFKYADKRRRDIDNPAKLILDSLKGIMYADDSQIDELHLYRRKQLEPFLDIKSSVGASIHIWTLDNS